MACGASIIFCFVKLFMLRTLEASLQIRAAYLQWLKRRDRQGDYNGKQEMVPK
jgi:hypothetical protein